MTRRMDRVWIGVFLFYEVVQFVLGAEVSETACRLCGTRTYVVAEDLTQVLSVARLGNIRCDVRNIPRDFTRTVF